MKCEYCAPVDFLHFIVIGIYLHAIVILQCVSIYTLSRDLVNVFLVLSVHILTLSLLIEVVTYFPLSSTILRQ